MNQQNTNNTLFEKDFFDDINKITSGINRVIDEIFICYVNLNDFSDQKKIVKDNSSKNYYELLLLKKKRLDLLGIRVINDIKFINDNNKSKKSNERTYEYDIKKTLDKKYISFSNLAIFTQKYMLYDDVIYEKKNNILTEVLLSYKNNHDGKIEYINYKKMNVPSKSISAGLIGIVLFYILFLFGIMMKIKQISGSYVQIKYIILAFIFSIIVIKFIPRLKKGKMKKVYTKPCKDDINIEKISNNSVFLLNVDYFINLIHFLNENDNLSSYNIQCDISEVISKYKNVVDCNIRSCKVVNYNENSQKKVVSLICKIDLYRYVYKEKKEIEINKSVEKVLIVIEQIDNNILQIKEYKSV